jgi:hypothetical protein
VGGAEFEEVAVGEDGHVTLATSIAFTSTLHKMTKTSKLAGTHSHHMYVRATTLHPTPHHTAHGTMARVNPQLLPIPFPQSQRT